MARGRTLYLPVMVVAAVLMACAVALSTVEQKAEAAFPGKNGRIAYAAFGPRGDVIYTIGPRGAGNTRVTGGSLPSYSPDGERIAYSQFTQNDTEIYTINSDGSGKTKLTHNNTKDDNWPSYSPNGKRIAYVHTSGTSDEDNLDSDIYTIKVGGGDKSRVTYTDKADEYDLSYSPDGKKIAYTLYKPNDGLQGDIYTIDASGVGRTRVTNIDDKEYVQGTSWGSRP